MTGGADWAGLGWTHRRHLQQARQVPAELLLSHGQVAAAAEVHPEERDDRVHDDDADWPLRQAQGRDTLLPASMGFVHRQRGGRLELSAIAAGVVGGGGVER